MAACRPRNLPSELSLLPLSASHPSTWSASVRSYEGVATSSASVKAMLLAHLDTSP